MSFVVIAFNERRRIGRCLAGLLAQETSRSFEVLLVDDGSSDGTADVALSVGDDRIRVLRLPHNKGRGAARAAGIDAAVGRDVAFVDADIALPPDWLERVCDSLGSAAAAGGIAVPDGDVAPLARMFALTPRPTPGSGAVTGNNVLFAGEVVRSMPFPRSRLGEDFRFCRQLSAAGFDLVQLTDLHVAHDETRSWRGFVRWLFLSGVDATGLLVEFREFRGPDAVWLTVNALSLSAAAAVLPSAGFPAAVATGVGVFSALSATVAAAHVASRFRLRPAHRSAAAVAAHIPAMFAYLTGRNVGAVKLAVGRVRSRGQVSAPPYRTAPRPRPGVSSRQLWPSGRPLPSTSLSDHGDSASDQ